MKRVLFVGLMVFCVVGLVALSATNEVKSVNAVGYVKQSLTLDTYYLVATPLDTLGTTNPTMNEVLGTNFADFSTAYLYNGAGYDSSTFALGGWIPDRPLDRGVGVWVFPKSNMELTIMGEVPTLNETVYLSAGYQLVGYSFPVEMSVTSTVFNTIARDFDIIYKYNGAGYDQWTFAAGNWFPSGLTFSPGESFWYYAGGATNGTETVPYSL